MSGNHHPKMPNHGPRRSNGERERDLIFVSELYLTGVPQHDIAQQLSDKYYGGDKPLTQQQISYDVKQLHKRWQMRQLINVNDAKARELQRIDRVEFEAWDAWERSKQDAETVTTKGKGQSTEAPTSYERTTQKKGQVGDPRFLAIVERCVEQRIKLLGLDSGRTLNLLSDGKPIVVKEIVVELTSDNDTTTTPADLEG